MVNFDSFVIAVDYFQARYPDTTVIFDMSVVYITMAFFAVLVNNVLVESLSLGTRITFGEEPELFEGGVKSSNCSFVARFLSRVPGVFPHLELYRLLRDLVGGVWLRDLLHDQLGGRGRGLSRVHRPAVQLLRVHLHAAQPVHPGRHGRRE